MDPGEIISVSLEYFKSVALPPLRERIDIAKIKDSVQRDPEGYIQDLEQWAAFKSDPRAFDLSQEQAFEPPFDAVVREASKAANSPARLTLASRPTAFPIPEWSDPTLPDAYLLLVNTKSVDSQESNKNHANNSNPDSWDNIAVSFQFKRVTGMRNAKTLHHIMSSDPCRRAIFGVTIDNTEMKFWFTCRAVTLVSKPFDFLREPEHLIHFFCSVAFANDHELGWDPTIRRVRGEILVYEPTRVISDFTADALRGPGTRVFEVRLKTQDGKLVKDAEHAILKDSWRDCDRDREDTILEQIFTDLRNHKGIEQADEARKYFLTVLAAGNVMVDGKIDGADSLLRISDLPADCTSHPLPVDELSKPTWASEGLIPSSPYVPSPSKHSKVHHKIHSRLVFKEVCQPIYELWSLDTVFETLEDARNALQILHSVGWVHRDVSAGNVLRAGQMGKLAGLEYAKRMDSKNTHEVLTGTLDFMACEVGARGYLFEGLVTLPIDDTHESRQRDQFPFEFNPLHDMESLWWIPTWVLYYHVDQEGGQPSSGQAEWFQMLFSGQLGLRFLAFSASLDKDVLPASFQPPVDIVEELRWRVRLAYVASEGSRPPAYTDALEKLHGVFADRFTRAVEDSSGVRLFTPSTKRHLEDPTLET
ncbi:hypothetical protein EDC04DRAFT_2576906 [Pisolithus marmoratus]|nr:hypothetical protein EDC04DRAFT_2576906 [Pisolithus marmoratus]